MWKSQKKVRIYITRARFQSSQFFSQKKKITIVKSYLDFYLNTDFYYLY